MHFWAIDILSYLQYLLLVFHTLLFEFHTTRTKPGAQAHFSKGFLLRISTLEAWTIPGSPQKPVGLRFFIQLRLVVRDSLLVGFQKGEKQRIKDNHISTVPLLSTAVILLSSRLCRNFIPTNKLPNVQKSYCSPLYAVCLSELWTSESSSSATIAPLRLTEPGSNQTISAACCHSLSSSFHSGHIRFTFHRDWSDKTHNGQEGHRNVERQVNIKYLTLTHNRNKGRRNEAPSYFSLKPSHKCVCFSLNSEEQPQSVSSERHFPHAVQMLDNHPLTYNSG